MESLDAGAVEPDVVGGPANTELLAARGQLADQVGQRAVVGVASGLSAKEGHDVVGDPLPLDVELGRASVQEDEAGGVCRAADVLLSMLESGVRHVPVVDARRRLLGVVSDVDLVGLGWRSPLQLRSRIESATDVPGVAAAGLDLPRIVAGLVDEGADPIDVAGWSRSSSTR